METEAINTWGVCLSVKQLDGAGRETLPGPMSRPGAAVTTPGCYGQSGQEGQVPERQHCGQHLPPSRDGPHLSSSPLGPGWETGPHGGLTPPSRRVAVSPRCSRGQHTPPTPPAGPGSHGPRSERTVTVKSTHRNPLHSYTLIMRKQKEKLRKQFQMHLLLSEDMKGFVWGVPSLFFLSAHSSLYYLSRCFLHHPSMINLLFSLSLDSESLHCCTPCA